MVKHRTLKLTAILAGAVCICILLISPASRMGADSSVGKLSGREEYTGNKNATDRLLVSKKGQEDTDIWGADCITAIHFDYGRYTTQDDIIHIGQLHQLESLYINIDDETIDLSPLGNLGELKDMRFLTGCSPDLSFMEKLGKLEKLYIQTGEDADLSPLGSLSSLKQIMLTPRDLPDPSFLRELDRLEEVTVIKAHGLEDLSYFQDMINLKSLWISYVDDVDLEYLRKCKSLECIYIVGENIRNPEALADMAHLESLHLNNCYQGQEAFDLSPLAQLTELDSIMLIYLPVEDVSPLAEVDSLTAISLAGTGVEDISPLKDLDLRYLWISGNKSEKVRKQAEEYFGDVYDLVVEEKVPYH